LKLSQTLSNYLSTCTLFFFVFFLSLGFSLRTREYCKQCARQKDTLFPHHWGGGKQTSLSLSLTSVIILVNEVVMAGLILIDIMILNFSPDSIKFLHFTWDCYGRINIIRYYDIELHSWCNKISSLHYYG
jgi:hypothetical protein